MPVETNVRVERVLIVLNADGSIKGAHQERMAVTTNDGQVISASMLPAEPLSPEALSAVLPSVGDLAGQIATLQAQVTAMTREKADAEAAKAAAEAAKANAEAALAALQAQIAPVDEGGFPVLDQLQIRDGLRAMGVLSAQVQAIIDAIPDVTQRAVADDYWHYAPRYRRNHPLVAAIGSAIGLTTQQMDAGWMAAGGL